MKIFAHCDFEGKISSHVAGDGPKDAGYAGPKAGLSVFEIGGLTVKPGEKGVKELIEIARTYVVKTPQPVRFTRKRS